MPCSVALAEPPHVGEAQRLARLQVLRRGTQVGFFALFLLAPALNLLRFDLHEAQLWLLGRRCSLGISAFQQGQASATETALSIIGYGLLPVLALVLGFLWVARRWGRLYCGWLCPHFSLVEMLNGLLHRATGRFSLWDAAPTPRPGRTPARRWWPAFGLAAVFFAALWSVTLLTYLLPPAEVWRGLATATLTPNQARFIGVGTLLISAELVLARHLFCRFGCAVGFFQSLAWMANPRALVIGFSRERARECRGCATATAPAGEACEVACPMRLRPRNLKRLMFSCVQCGQCLSECAQSHATRGQPQPNLQWTVGVDALRETLRQRK